MALTQDDLQRLRDGISAGWNFKFCHELDFCSAVTELIDDALEEKTQTLAEKVFSLFPSVDKLQMAIDELEENANNGLEGLSDADVKILLGIQEKLEDYRDEIEEARAAAEALL